MDDVPTGLPDELGDEPAEAPGAETGNGEGWDGSLPEAATQRLGQGAWSTGLSIVDFASCLVMGMEPLGFVQGYAVMQWGWYGGTYYRTFGGMPGRASPDQYSEGWQCPHGFVGGEHRMYGFNYEQIWVEDNWGQGWGLAFGRMMEEAEALGAHGVIGVVDDMHNMAGSGAAEFRIQGTAVAVPGTPRPPHPFSTFLSGQRLIKMLESGYVPVSVAAAMSSVQMIGNCITHYQLAGSAVGNWSGAMSGGIAGVHSIVQVGRAQRAARHLARERVRSQLGGDMLHGASVELSEREIGDGDLAIECLVRGTRARRFKDFDPLPEPQPVVRLT